MSGLVDEGGQQWTFDKVFDTVFLTAEQMEGGVNKKTENRLKGMISGTKSKWRPVSGSDWVQPCPKTSLMIWMMRQIIPTADRELGLCCLPGKSGEMGGRNLLELRKEEHKVLWTWG